MIASTSLFLVRHAEVEARYQRVFGGRIDMDLSPHGHEQAAALARLFKTKRLDAVYASPMKRVQQTLQAFTHGEVTPVILPGLREVEFGDWTGLGWEEVREKFNISPFQWLQQLDAAQIPNADSSETFRARVEPCLHSILEAHPGQTVAIACHGGTIRMLLSLLLALPFSKTGMFEIDYASVTEVRHAPPRTDIRLLNFTPWRGLP